MKQRTKQQLLDKALAYRLRGQLLYTLTRLTYEDLAKNLKRMRRLNLASFLCSERAREL
jgi:hypothetical protein